MKCKNFPSNVSAIISIWKYDYNSSRKPNASTVPMQNARDAWVCKCNFFFIFRNKWDMKEINESTTLKPYNHSQTIAKQDTKVKDT